MAVLDLFFRVLGVVLAPLAAIVAFAVESGRRRARLASRAKTAADLLVTTPPDSAVRTELMDHFERSARMYLLAFEPRRYDWSTLRRGGYAVSAGVLIGFPGLIFSLEPRDRPAFLGDSSSAPAMPAFGIPVVVVAVCFFALGIWLLGNVARRPTIHGRKSSLNSWVEKR